MGGCGFTCVTCRAGGAVTYTVVLPYAHQPYKDECEQTWKFNPDSVLLVDNTVKNRGIQYAYNLGVDKMREDNTDWLVHLSAAVRFGKPGGLDFIDTLDNTDSLVVETSTGYGWHLIAFHKTIIEQCGYWDVNFRPYGYDDLDYSMRIQRTFTMAEVNWWKTPVDLVDKGQGHGIKLAGVTFDKLRHIEYFAAKWGRHPDLPGRAEYCHPFNQPAKPVWWWPPLTVDGETYSCGMFACGMACGLSCATPS